jgi:light-regulated signal transduction histidine kinase (bacteriophytochrome)
VVLLSARAGEESLVAGLETGADDYLIKPFSSRELLARVQTHLDMARLRRSWAHELARVNQELEAFTYSVSHDLRAPLRPIDGFSSVLLEIYGASLDEQATHYLRRIRTAAQRMGQLIDDLLNLSRVTRGPLRREPIDVTGLAQQIASDLRERHLGRSVELVVADGLTALADGRLVRVLLENLLGNAWKFTAKKPVARIEVGRHELEDERVLFVRDDGAGFDMAQSARLFAPFQRLHTEAEFEGTGIGLATAGRIVARHGGRIWAEAAVGRGATIFFTLEPAD